ncbi:hypothetical protein EVAR_43383_1 [Eumeta japonica]|uniref:Uncharacterized protein n=1 Tax=Eumeta variegata TaxID=151549 RepID=A0A4C1WSK8_EUMVA|nr:hypothetical protein EVAR_43383_1 [Eumeta japonica]
MRIPLGGRQNRVGRRRPRDGPERHSQTARQTGEFMESVHAQRKFNRLKSRVKNIRLATNDSVRRYRARAPSGGHAPGGPALRHALYDVTGITRVITVFGS